MSATHAGFSFPNPAHEEAARSKLNRAGREAFPPGNGATLFDRTEAAAA